MMAEVKKEVFYGMGVDVARGGSDAGTVDRDDFSIGIMQMSMSGCRYVKAVRANDVTIDQMSGMVHWEANLFHPAIIVMDPGGGGAFVRDKLREREQTRADGTPFVVAPIVTEDDTVLRGAGALPILSMFKRRDPKVARALCTMADDSVLINRAHEECTKAIQGGQLQFPPPWPGWD